MKDVFVLGAGFSRAISQHMPTLQELGALVRARGGLPATLPRLELDVEMALSYLAQPHPWNTEAENLRNRADFLDVAGIIAAVIRERTSLVVQSSLPAWLDRLVRYWHDTRSVVLTLNYDVLVERSAQHVIRTGREPKALSRLSGDLLYPIPLPSVGQRLGAVFGSDPFDTFSLYKLHGSTNWYYSGPGSASGDPIYHAPIKDGWSDHWIEYHPADNLSSDKVPVVIPPLADKQPYYGHETIRALWRLAGGQLRGARRVLALGYSLPATDLTMRFFLESNVPRERTTLIVVNPDPSVIPRYESLRGAGYDVDTRFVVDRTPIDLMVDTLLAP